MATTTLRFRNAKTKVVGDITAIRGELLDMPKVAKQVYEFLKNDTALIEELGDIAEERRQLKATTEWIERLTPRQVTTVMGWLNESDQ
jgi:hypothetical protein